MLRGAATAAGCDVTVLDLAIEEIHARCSRELLALPTGVAGDHDKHSAELERAEREFFMDVRAAALCAGLYLSADHLREGMLSFMQAQSAAAALADSQWGMRKAGLVARAPAPDLIGISVMFADQVVAALAVTRIARACWPGVPIVWGGAHVTALAPEIAVDGRYGIGIDGFVSGYAEQTFVELLQAIWHRRPWPRAVFVAGGGSHVRARDALETEPLFTRIDQYGLPRLTLAAQVSRGCSYGACAFCTYPAVEGAYRAARGTGHAGAVVELAECTNAVVSFKDSLLTPLMLTQLVREIDGRAEWAGCTKLQSDLVALIPKIARAGCITIEVGLESVVPSTQLLVMKRQSPELFLRVADECATAGVRLVVNYMTGFPGEDATHARDGLAWVTEMATARGARVQHQTFALERRAPMAQSVAATASWPWSSMLQWNVRAERRAA
jgi:hypothetical protein